jgi:hypothetical protein
MYVIFSFFIFHYYTMPIEQIRRQIHGKLTDASVTRLSRILFLTNSIKFSLNIIYKNSNQHWLQQQRQTLKENPYVGLSAFQPADAERFFGRQQFT